MKNIVIGGVGLLVVGSLAGCERKPTEPGEIPGAAATGMLRVLLGSESPTGQLDPRVEEVWVRIDSVEARHQSEGWVTVSNERQDIDLLAGMGGLGGDDDGGLGGGDDGGDDGGLGGGDDGGGDDGGGLGGGQGAVGGGGDDDGGAPGGVQDDDDAVVDYERIGEGRVWAGGYERLHLGVTDTWVVVDGAQQDLMFIGNIDPLDPFDAGLTIREPFYVDEGKTTSIQVSWNVGENLEQNDNGNWTLGTQTTIEVDIEAEAPGEGPIDPGNEPGV